MIQPNFYLTESGYRALVKGGGWQINDIPLPLAEQIKDHSRVSSSFALFASGLAPEALAEYRGKSVAGMDWVRAEDKPKLGELPLNVYHYLVGSPGKNGYPVFACGHGGVLTPSGWCTLPDLEAEEYEWAQQAMEYWPQRVKEKCKTNKSFAIAHGLV